MISLMVRAETFLGSRDGSRPLATGSYAISWNTVRRDQETTLLRFMEEQT